MKFFKINLEIKDILLIFAVEIYKGIKMETGYITVLPNKKYGNLAKEITNNLRCCDIIQYGYIKLRDLNKWENGEAVAVKMGMLTPSKPSYKNLSIIGAACKRISEQDSTALFEDGDELVPVYVFVSEITDNEWRENLISKGYKSSRKNASREGIKIDRKNLFGEYGFFFNEDTKESKTIQKEQEENRLRAMKERIVRHLRAMKEKEEKENREKEEYNKIYGENAFDNDYRKLVEIYGNAFYDAENKIMFSTYKTRDTTGLKYFCFFGFFTLLCLSVGCFTGSLFFLVLFGINAFIAVMVLFDYFDRDDYVIKNVSFRGNADNITAANIETLCAPEVF